MSDAAVRTGSGQRPGTGTVNLAEVTERDLDLKRHLDAVAGPGFGAVASFIGQIRDHDPESSGRVERLEYSAHPDAQAILERISAEVVRPETSIAVSHRVGSLDVGEPALIACVASAHRELAFEVSRELVERIKREVPIWKRQFVADGSHNWQGLK